MKHSCSLPFRETVLSVLEKSAADQYRDHELSFIDACILDDGFLLINLIELERYVTPDTDMDTTNATIADTDSTIPEDLWPLITELDEIYPFSEEETHRSSAEEQSPSSVEEISTSTAVLDSSHSEPRTYPTANIVKNASESLFPRAYGLLNRKMKPNKRIRCRVTILPTYTKMN